ncbi:MAG: phosphosulfolactate synthase, partial [Burkholderiales bacterium]|nr:phosphosulfolactate synthase [Burkholderiales bacterium]
LEAVAFPMIEVERIPPKPRRHSMLLMSEVGIPLRVTEDLLEIAAPIIDYAKITDHVGLSDRLSAAWIRRKVALYNSHGVKVLPGGIPFQLAAQQGKVAGYFRAVRDLGFAGVEISEDTMEPLDPKRRDDLVAEAQALGLKVMTEMGRKNLDKPFEVEEIIGQIHHDIEIGVSHIYLESSEIQALFEQDPSALDRLAALGMNEFLLFELGLNQSQEKAAWLVERYGVEINFASVSPADVVAVDAIRRGIHRKANYRAMI